jgi:hypothetical protein
VCLQLVGFRKCTLQESTGLRLLDGMVYNQGSTTAKDSVAILAEQAKTFTVTEIRQSLPIAHKFATHRNKWTVGVYRALLVQHFHRNIEGIQHEDVLTQNIDMRNVPCT